MTLRWTIASLAFCSLALAEGIPKMEGHAVSGKTVTLPDAVRGRTAVLIFGFSKSSNTQTLQWAKQLKAEQKANPALLVYSLPVLESVPRLVRGIVVGGIKGSTDVADRDYMVPLFSGEAALKALVGYGPPDDAYAVVVDAAGNVTWKGHGVARETFEKCREALGAR